MVKAKILENPSEDKVLGRLVGLEFEILDKRNFFGVDYYLLKTEGIKGMGNSIWQKSLLYINGTFEERKNTDPNIELLWRSAENNIIQFLDEKGMLGDAILYGVSIEDTIKPLNRVGDKGMSDTKRKEFIDVKGLEETYLAPVKDDLPCVCGKPVTHMVIINNVPFLVCAECVAYLGKRCINSLR